MTDDATAEAIAAQIAKLQWRVSVLERRADGAANSAEHRAARYDELAERLATLEAVVAGAVVLGGK